MEGIWLLVAAVAAGILMGLFVPSGERAGRWLSRALSVLLYALIVMMGVKIGATEEVFGYLPELGLQAALFAAVTIALSVLATRLLEKAFGYKAPVAAANTVVEDKRGFVLPMSVRIVLTMIAGVLAGRLLPVGGLTAWLDTAVLWGLCAMVFVVGMDISRSRDTLGYLRAHGKGALIAPAGAVVGSVAGGILVGLLLGHGWTWGGAIGSGLGWYTFSGLAIARVDVRMGALAFLANLLREVFSMICIPWIAKRWGPLAAITPGGTTAMDTTLSIIVRATSAGNAVTAFISGVICALLIPPLIGFFIQFTPS